MRSILIGLVLWATCASPAAGVDFGQAGEKHGRPHPCAAMRAEALGHLLAGSRGPSPNQEDYDARYYDLDIYFQMGLQKKIYGTVTMRAEVTGSSISACDLDLVSTKIVDSVRVAGMITTYSRLGDILTVDLDRAYLEGEEFEVAVTYHGNVTGGGLITETLPSGVLIWSLSQPYDARGWWPCKDWPADKVDSVDLHVDVPDNMVVASNGLLRSVEHPGSRAIYHWHENYPIVTYLVSVACHPYTVFSDWYHYGADDSMEIRNYVIPAHLAEAQQAFSIIAPAMELYADQFGEYPFLEEKYGHAEVTASMGLEAQTCTSLGIERWADMLVHELAHHWWGNAVTCESFHHIWLNEGFATYAEALWQESVAGREAYQSLMASTAYYGPGTICVEDPDVEDIFPTELTYYKASWVPHMLRHVVGDSVFFETLREFISTKQYGAATTEDFRDICESVCGLDLDQFFHQWIYEEYFPVYSFDWSWQEGARGSEISLAIDQLQTNTIFHMPIDVTVHTAAGETTIVVGDSLAHQEFTLAVDAEPTWLELDRDRWILCQVLGEMPEPTFDRGILVVNGMDYTGGGEAVSSCYADSVFWGDHDICFWDVFPAESLWYPPNLPSPLGHGYLPPDTLKQFSTVVWAGVNWAGDLEYWYDVPILSYLQAGGNLLLLARTGMEYLYDSLRDYAGVLWTYQDYDPLGECLSVVPNLVDMRMIGQQTMAAVFDTSLTTDESTLLFVDTTGHPGVNGVGVHRRPAGGGSYRPKGGQMVFLSGFPCYWNHDDLRANVQYILDHFFEEPYDPTSGVGRGDREGVFSLAPNQPNPFNPVTRVSFQLPETGQAWLRVYDVTGRLVATLAEGILEAGGHTVTWEGTDAAGRPVASGVYFCRLASGGGTASRKMVLLQ